MPKQIYENILYLTGPQVVKLIKKIKKTGGCRKTYLLTSKFQFLNYRFNIVDYQLYREWSA